MSDFDLYHWSVPFRGQFIRGILAYAEASWTEYDSCEIGELMGRHPSGQPVPFMVPPVLVDNANGFSIAQTPAIALYLGEKLDLLPPSLEMRAQSVKVVNDANDVLDEITLDGGRQMWTGEKWSEFMPRLRRWMEIWEATGHAGGLTPWLAQVLIARTGAATAPGIMIAAVALCVLPILAAMRDVSEGG
ncbi:glutathione S-transferase [Novosphingobium resinovorum]|uniref:glutathione S-transferase n=1 Tax=Novosphingobium resinovorum TaxID=158500 RepID=UPI002ED3ADD9|nr:glutathione S-transferase [Novosphingobium resinovorum]